MSDPEIDRRCISCGASVRSQALFCPQCGQPISHSAPAEKDGDAKTNVAESAPTVSLDRDVATDNAATQQLLSAPDFSQTQPLIKPNPATEGSFQSPANVARSSTVARGLEANVMGRVEKIRKASSVVIDQAAYDPSLRFILVAIVLFVLFLFLLILSKVLG
ncbi:MAG TPA: zinc ribbon domain-containing protein [Pyrinomonadaceae bacterium]|nr:zinc ribbon domain-containing protein [Pyrinomonadaceae bacterium]